MCKEVFFGDFTCVVVGNGGDLVQLVTPGTESQEAGHGG